MIDREVLFVRARANPFGGSTTQRQVDDCNAILGQWEKRDAAAVTHARASIC